MKNALIGHTGFVGTNLLDQYGTFFTELFNSQNSLEMRGKKFNSIFCAGISSLRWKANKDPEADWLAIQKLIDTLKTVSADYFVLISTADVYAEPVGLDEDAPISQESKNYYGLHRYRFELFVQEHFPKTYIFRLPLLFGKGLKKNVIYDFLYNNCIDMIHQGMIAQYYDLHNFRRDIERVIAYNIPVINITSTPLSIQNIVDEVFHNDFTNNLDTPPRVYDYHSKYSALWGRPDSPYLYGKEEVIAQMKRFVADCQNAPNFKDKYNS